MDISEYDVDIQRDSAVIAERDFLDENARANDRGVGLREFSPALYVARKSRDEFLRAYAIKSGLSLDAARREIRALAAQVKNQI
jgi:hypothetical protein